MEAGQDPQGQDPSASGRDGIRTKSTSHERWPAKGHRSVKKGNEFSAKKLAKPIQALPCPALSMPCLRRNHDAGMVPCIDDIHKGPQKASKRVLRPASAAALNRLWRKHQPLC